LICVRHELKDDLREFGSCGHFEDYGPGTVNDFLLDALDPQLVRSCSIPRLRLQDFPDLFRLHAIGPMKGADSCVPRSHSTESGAERVATRKP